MRILVVALLMSAVSAHLTFEPEEKPASPKAPQRIPEHLPVTSPQLSERSSDGKPIEPLVLCEKLWRDSGYKIRQYVPKSQLGDCE